MRPSTKCTGKKRGTWTCLEGGGSGAGDISGRIKLDREVTEVVLGELQDHLVWLTTFCSVIWGTRFRYFEKANMPHTTCQRRIGQPERICGEGESPELLLQGAELEEAHSDAPELVLLLAELVRRASDSNPGNVSPVYQLAIAKRTPQKKMLISTAGVSRCWRSSNNQFGRWHR